MGVDSHKWDCDYGGEGGRLYAMCGKWQNGQQCTSARSLTPTVSAIRLYLFCVERHGDMKITGETTCAEKQTQVFEPINGTCRRGLVTPVPLSSPFEPADITTQSNLDLKCNLHRSRRWLSPDYSAKVTFENVRHQLNV